MQARWRELAGHALRARLVLHGATNLFFWLPLLEFVIAGLMYVVATLLARDAAAGHFLPFLPAADSERRESCEHKGSQDPSTNCGHAEPRRRKRRPRSSPVVHTSTVGGNGWLRRKDRTPDRHALVGREVTLVRNRYGYRVNGAYLRRVTTLLGGIPKPALTGWAANAVAKFAIEHKASWETLPRTARMPNDETSAAFNRRGETLSSLICPHGVLDIWSTTCSIWFYEAESSSRSYCSPCCGSERTPTAPRFRCEIERRTERELSISAVYTTLQRLEHKGLVRTRMGEPLERGGRRRKYVELLPAGARALKAAYDALAGMTAGLELRLKAL